MTERAPRSPDAEGRLFACINSRLDENVFNDGQMVLHDYATNQLSQFSRAMSIAAMCSPERIIERCQGVERRIAEIIATLREQIASAPGHVLQKLLHSKFDVTVLLKSRGGGAALGAMLKQYFDSVAGTEGVETVACSHAGSAAAQALFAHGKRRIALPSTQFLLHRSSREGVERKSVTEAPSAITEPIRKWITEVDDPTIEKVLSSIQEPQRSKIEHLFQKDKHDLGAERRIEFTGQDAPGFVTTYLDEHTPLGTQLSQRYGVQIPLADYQRFGLAEFVVLSEIERDIAKSPLASKGIWLSVRGGRLRMDGDSDFRKEGPAIKSLIQSSMKKLGLAT